MSFLVPRKLSADIFSDFAGSPVFKFRTSKDKKSPNLFDIDITEKKLSGIKESEFNRNIEKVSDHIKEKIDARITVCKHLSGQKYESVPSLPINLFEKDEKLGNSVMTGVRLTFQKTNEELKSCIVDVSPCLGCGEVALKIQLMMARKMRPNLNEIGNVLDKAEDYFKYFYKVKKIKNA